jgi:hypothetical protein
MRDIDAENAIFDERFPPDRVEKLALREDVPRVSDQRNQQLMGLRFESDRVAVPCEAALDDVEGELPNA